MNKKNRDWLAKLRELGYDEATEGYAGVVELADTLDSKSSEAYPSCGFKSHLRHHDSYLVSSRSCLANKTLDTSCKQGEGFEAKLSASWGELLRDE